MVDLKKNADEKKHSQMDEVGDRICRLVESERLKNVDIGRLKDENNGLVLKVEEEREKWLKVCWERDEIEDNYDGLFKEIRDLRKKMIEMEKNEKRDLEETEYLKVKCKKLLAEKMESEIMNKNLLKEKKIVERLLDESEAVSLRRTIEIITHDKVEMEEAKMEVKNVVMDLRRELSKVNEAMTSESSMAKNKRNEESVSQMGCSRENPNEVSPEKDNLSLRSRTRRES
ncbi:uncharacterized protein LOC111470467 [Cucurbita maxima]|uniref:Uncharacterized protein LOC111470467 n=1 Tax=Cucurbita maxima TaxID=3661 RepID=A0A6J1I9J8_CUCMA|nr:uncharacterized protein LOC111470467 [Cucurbita maxima]